MKTILVPIDLSRGTGRVVAVALDLARRTASRLVLLHVAEPPPVELHGVGFARRQIGGMLAVLKERAARRLQTLGRRAAQSGCPVVTAQVSGRSAAVILNHAAARRVAFIVMGSHGHGAAYEFVVGSTAQAVLHAARCPVLVVPLPRATGFAR